MLTRPPCRQPQHTKRHESSPVFPVLQGLLGFGRRRRSSCFSCCLLGQQSVLHSTSSPLAKGHRAGRFVMLIQSPLCLIWRRVSFSIWKRLSKVGGDFAGCREINSAGLCAAQSLPRLISIVHKGQLSRQSVLRINPSVYLNKVSVSFLSADSAKDTHSSSFFNVRVS